MKKLFFAASFLTMSSTSFSVSATEMVVKGPSQPFMFEEVGYTGSAPYSGFSSFTALRKNAKVRLPNGEWRNLPSTRYLLDVSTSLTFKSTNKHLVSLYLKLLETFVKLDPNGKPVYFHYIVEYSGSKAVDPCQKNVECI